MDRTVRDLFRSLEKVNGRRSIERMLLEVVPPGADPIAVAALAQLAREYLLLEYRYTPVMVDGKVVDQTRLNRFKDDEARRTPRVNSPFMDDLRPTTKVRDAIGREHAPHTSAKGRKGRSYFKDAEKAGKMPFVLDGKTHMLPPSIVALLTQDPTKNG